VAVAAREWPSGPFVTVGLSLAFLLVTGLRDGRDYFVRWAALPEVRRLYRADLHDAAPTLRALPAGSPVGLASYNLHPADALALGLETPGRGLQPRPFSPARAWLWPAGDEPVLLLGTSPADGAFGVAGPAGHFEVRSSRNPAYAAPEAPLEVAFANGWTCTGYTLARKADAMTLDTYWRVDEGYVPPAPRPVEVISGTPLPLKFFSHVLDADGGVLAGDDRLDLDPAYLRAGDEFIQRFQLALPAGLAAGEYVVQVGLYDPATGARVPLANGEDRLVLTTLSVP
jgi:hypothetical protein